MKNCFKLIEVTTDLLLLKPIKKDFLKRIQGSYTDGKLYKVYDSEGEFSLEIGDIITLPTRKFRINSIEVNDFPKSEAHIQLRNHVFSLTDVFIPPLLFSSRKQAGVNKYYTKAYLSTYYDKADPLKDQKLFIVYSSYTKDFFYFLKELEKMDEFVGYREPDKYTTVVEFKLPDESTPYLELIMQGKYSQLPEDMKKKILSYNMQSATSSLGQSLYKDPELRAMKEKELGVPPGTIPEENELLESVSVEQLKRRNLIIEDE